LPRKDGGGELFLWGGRGSRKKGVMPFPPAVGGKKNCGKKGGEGFTSAREVLGEGALAAEKKSLTEERRAREKVPTR